MTRYMFQAPQMLKHHRRRRKRFAMPSSKLKWSPFHVRGRFSDCLDAIPGRILPAIQSSLEALHAMNSTRAPPVSLHLPVLDSCPLDRVHLASPTKLGNLKPYVITCIYRETPFRSGSKTPHPDHLRALRTHIVRCRPVTIANLTSYKLAYETHSLQRRRLNPSRSQLGRWALHCAACEHPPPALHLPSHPHKPASQPCSPRSRCRPWRQA